jgi:cytochrome oxidase assembly protein ShyY1
VGVWRDLGAVAAPRLLPLHLLGLVATVAAVLLGLWQVEAWQAQREAEARDLTSLAPVPLVEVLDSDQPFPSAAVGRPVQVTGQWLPESSFFVTGRDLDGREGLWAITPVAVCDDPSACPSAPALLVVRGWTADADTAPEPPDGTVALTGWLQPPEGTGRPDPDPRDDLLPEVRIADAIQRVDQDLYGAYLVAESAQPAAGLAGVEAVTPESLPDPGSGAGLRNFLYGIQWFVFAGFALFIWWRWAKDEVDRSRKVKAAAEDEQPQSPEVPSSP